MIRDLLGRLRVLEMRSPSEPETAGYDFIRYEMPPDSPLHGVLAGFLILKPSEKENAR